MNTGSRARGLLAVAASTIILTLGACVIPSGDPSDEIPEPLATGEGAAEGPATSVTVGAAGGVVSAPDGRLSVGIPAGALASDTQVTLQPTTNTAPGGLGLGYRVSMQGEALLHPVSLTFTYADADLEGTALEALGLAFRTDEGYWQLEPDATVDAAAKTITTSTLDTIRAVSEPLGREAAPRAGAIRVMDVAYLRQFRLNPAEKTIHLTDAVLLQVERCFELLGERVNGERQLLGFDWQPFGVTIAARTLSDWSVNGIPGGNGTLGTIDGRIERGGYTPPETKPDPSTVTVSVKLADIRDLQRTALLESKITLIDEGRYTGTVDFSIINEAMQITNGLARVTWTLVEDLGDVRRYVPTGTISADINIDGCSSLSATVPIFPTELNGVGMTLVVYTASNSAFPSRYQFGLAADDTVLVFMCGDDPPRPVRIPAGSLLAFLVGICTEAIELPTFTDEGVLKGTFSCAETGLTASWDLRME